MESIPEGYLKNSQGHLVPIDVVSEFDLDRDRLVREIVREAQNVRKDMASFKSRAMGDFAAFVELSAERYDVRLGGKKGNTTLYTFDGKYKIQVAVSDRIRFDEGIQAAKELIDECIIVWSAGSSSEIRALVDHAFQVDKEGRIAFGRVLSLMRLDIQDEKWQRAMGAIRDSMCVDSTKSYLRIYERDEDGAYKQIPLDMAAI